MVRRALRRLDQEGHIAYEPPFRGRGVEKLVDTPPPFDEVPIDWERQEFLRGLEEEKLEAMEAYIRSRGCRRGFIVNYFGEELDLTSEETWPPWKAAVLTGLSFAIASVVPIVPFAVLKVTQAAITAAIASIAALFAVGAGKATFTRKSWITSGLEMMAIGTLAAAATYAIGLLIPE